MRPLVVGSGVRSRLGVSTFCGIGSSRLRPSAETRKHGQLSCSTRKIASSGLVNADLTLSAIWSINFGAPEWVCLVIKDGPDVAQVKRHVLLVRGNEDDRFLQSMSETQLV